MILATKENAPAMNIVVMVWSVLTHPMEVWTTVMMMMVLPILMIIIFAVTGNCLPVFGKKAGENCYMDADCETGYVCQDSMCQVPAPGVGQFGTSTFYIPHLVNKSVSSWMR